jgi:hypothetical protein
MQHMPPRIEASCYTCFKTACVRQCNPPEEEKPGSYKTAFLIDDPQAELNAYVNRSVRSGDHLLTQSSSGTKLRFEGDHPRLGTKAFPLFRLRRAWKLRSTVFRGGTVAKAHFELAQILARTYCKHVNYDTEHICLAQTLLPHVWKAGSLAGCSFDVLMEEKLQRATALYPYSKTLEEFRAPKWFAEAEEEALRAARRVVTPHPQIAALFKNAMRIAWDMPSRETKVAGGDREKDLVVFFGPTIARKGAYAVREIVKELGCELTVVGSELEGPDFWRGLRVRRIELASLPWDRIHTVLQPALFEFWPRNLLRAQAAGSHLVISDCCGIEENHENGVYHVPFGDPASAVAIMETLLANRGKALCV